ncbi:hypothetical protein [Oceanidesulfovibrio marinus]|uniref:Uncharacterized protein n=1 Tax=Oceanidesulfovibrio marinus TaxID=370038 RepID=A0A6P1ZJY2_9BACT|nr:hypothetical protein [Oceanidesulfovibrio marinus]QJT09996.1 hypothetical protein E8L03_14125 [Oceanidesulfovibrio marinus]TVM35886.1 hypothetical protein DQK91_04315 [Oceanidesulfovibrio marinus]
MQIDGTTTSLFQSFSGYGAASGQGFTLSGSSRRASDASDAFGLDMARRLQDSPNAATKSAPSDAAASEQTDAGTQTEQPDASRLGSALAQTAEFIRGKFGDDAATAAMGIIYKSVGDGPLSEENLGKGLLNVVRMVDKNYGFAAGDTLMGQLNGELNNALNDYFDNGFQETFFAVTPEVSQNMASALNAANLGGSLDDVDLPSLIDMLRDSLAEGGALTDETVTTLEQAELDPTTLTPDRLQRLIAQAVPEESGAAAPSAYDMAAAAQYAAPQAGMLLNQMI